MVSALAWVLLGVVIGAFGTLIGAGGGFLLLPLLVLLYPHDSPALLTAISLSVVMANATSGSIAYARMGRIDFRAGLLFAAAGFPGSILGALLAHRIDRRVFDPILGVVLIGAGAVVFLRRPPDHGEAATGTRRLVERNGTVHHYSPRLALGALISVGVGFLSSLLGIGGGILHVPIMTHLLGFPTHIATATSHFVLALLALSGVLVHVATGDYRQAMGRALPIAVGVLVGAQAGARLSSRLRPV